MTLVNVLGKFSVDSYGVLEESGRGAGVNQGVGNGSKECPISGTMHPNNLARCALSVGVADESLPPLPLPPKSKRFFVLDPLAVLPTVQCTII